MTAVMEPEPIEIEVVGVAPEVSKAVNEVYQANNHGTRLTYELVEAARPESSPLHTHFEWNDGIAAEEYRLVQAAGLVRQIRVVKIEQGTLDEEPRKYSVRRYVATRDLSPDAEPGSFTDVMELAGNTAAELAVEEAIKRDLARLARKYANIQAFWTLVHEWTAGDDFSED